MFDSIAIDYRLFVRSVRKYSQSKFANFDIPSTFPSLAPPIFYNSYCLDCGKTFSSYQRLAVHRKVSHGIRDPVDLLVDTVHCPVCLVYFHNRVRVLNHIKYRSSVCRLNLKVAGPIITAEQADVFDVECRELRRKRYAEGQRAHAAGAEPCFRLCGPIPLPLMINGNRFTSKCHTLGFGRNYH